MLLTMNQYTSVRSHWLYSKCKRSDSQKRGFETAFPTTFRGSFCFHGTKLQSGQLYLPIMWAELIKNKSSRAKLAYNWLMYITERI
jgi:hypothetical protein